MLPYFFNKVILILGGSSLSFIQNSLLYYIVVNIIYISNGFTKNTDKLLLMAIVVALFQIVLL